MVGVEGRVTGKNGRCLGYMKNEHLESNLPCKPEGFSLQNCSPLARKHINKMVGDRTESWSQGHGVAAELRERKISHPCGVRAVDSKAFPASPSPSKGNLQECMHGARRLDLG